MKKTGFPAEMIESSEQRSTNSFLFNLAMGVLLFTIFGMSLNTYMVIGFYIIFGIGCGIAFGNTMNYAEKTAGGSTHSFIFLLILAVACLAIQVIGLKTYKEN